MKRSIDQLLDSNGALKDVTLAEEAAYAEAPYRNVEITAKNNNLPDVAHDMAHRAVAESNKVLSDALNQENNERQLHVLCRTFEDAAKIPRDWSEIVDEYTTTGSLRAGNFSTPYVKFYMDQLDPTGADFEITQDPARLAVLYSATSRVVVRNSKVFVQRSIGGDATKANAKQVADSWRGDMTENNEEVEAAIVAWCKGGKGDRYPVAATQYRSSESVKHFGVDIFDAMSPLPEGIRSNIRIQRQLMASFIMAYSDSRVREKVSKQAGDLTRRIYLNPDFEATPEIFEEILAFANENGHAIQLKMLQRVDELASNYRKGDRATVRGDGIVVYAGESTANIVLEKILQIAERNPQAFVGREISRIPQVVADGIAVGDEPVGAKGASLTSHRSVIIESALDEVRSAGLSGPEARKKFLSALETRCENENVKYENIAFNAV